MKILQKNVSTEGRFPVKIHGNAKTCTSLINISKEHLLLYEPYIFFNIKELKTIIIYINIFKESNNL